MADVSKQENLFPIDFMTYTQNLVDFLGEDEVMEEYMDRWRERVNSRVKSTNGPPSPGPVPKNTEEDPLILSICQSLEDFDRYFRTGELALSNAVLDTATLGRAITELSSCDVVNPAGEPVETSFEKVFRHRITSEENFWDAVFELEFAAILSRHGFDVKLIEEQHEGGPDIYVETADSPVRFECKRKREKTSAEKSYNQLKQRTRRQFWNKVSIGPDSFVARISADVGPEKLTAENLSDGLGYLVQNQNERVTFDFGGSDVDFELLDYYAGEYVAPISKGKPMKMFSSDNEGKRAQEIIDTMSPNPMADILQTDPLSHLEYEIPDRGSGLGDFTIILTDEGNTQVRNAHIIIFDFPFDVEYWSKIKHSFDSARNNLSGFCPSVAVVDIPASKWELMGDKERKYKEEVVSGRKRLEISMKGIMEQNSSINCLSVTSRYINRTANGVERGRFGEPMIQKFPQCPLPDDVETFLTELSPGNS